MDTRTRHTQLVGCILLALSFEAAMLRGAGQQEAPFEVVVVEENDNGEWPVSQVRLRTTHGLEWITDNLGTAAIDSPELMGREVWLSIDADGYEYPRDGFGFSGVRATVVPGGSRVIRVRRNQPARRIGRLTGGGLFAEAQKCGRALEWEESGVFGSDSVQLARHNDRLHWVWGDTSLPHYPLGLFEAAGAKTGLSPLSEYCPPLTLKFNYFRDGRERPRNVASVPGSGPTWLSGMTSLPDENGKYRLVAHYVKVQPPLTVYRTGLVVWNEELGVFQPLQELWQRSEQDDVAPPAPVGHVTFWTDDAGVDWVLFGDPFPSLRCRASFAEWKNPDGWELLEPQSTVPQLDGEQPDVRPHRGSIMWSNYRKKWVTVFCKAGGVPSPLGEIWYAEADSPLGPWTGAVKIASHRNYSFYNPRIDHELFPADAPFLLFEGTYTKMFSGNPHPTPRHNYNQVLYRLDYDDLPAPSTAVPGDTESISASGG